MKSLGESGSAVTDVVIAAAVIVFLIFPAASFVLEKYIIINKAQMIKDAVDMTNISTYNALDAASLGKTVITMQDSRVEQIYTSLLAKNLKLDCGLFPREDSIVEGRVSIDSIIIYTGGFPLTCPDGAQIKRPAVHSRITVPVRPSLYRQTILSILGKQYVELKVHVDSDIPVNN